MIEEEDDDDKVLEKGLSVKGALKAFLVILLIVVGAYFMYLGFSPDNWGNFLIGILFLCLGTTLMQMQKQHPEPLRQTLSILVCSICGLTKVRNYMTGDFVFNKTVDKCNKCNDSMEIKQIYSVKLKKPVAETKKKEVEKDKKES